MPARGPLAGPVAWGAYLPLLAALVALPLRAQVPPAAGDTLTLERAVALALARSPELAQAEARSAMAAAGRYDQWGRLVPSLFISAGALQQDVLQRTATDPITGGIVALPDSLIRARNTFGSSGAISLDWTVFDGGQRLLGIRRAGRDAAAAEHALEAARARVAAGVSLAYLDVLEADAHLRVRQSEVERAQSLAEAAEVRFQVGEAPEIDVLQARLTSSDAELALLEAEESLEAARLGLAEYLGGGGVGLAGAVLTPPAPPARLDDEALRRCLIDGSHELAGLRERVRSAGLQASASSWAFLPTVRVGSTWSRSEFGSTRDAVTLEPRNERRDYRVTFSWSPLDQPGRWVGDRQRARAQEAEADAALAARRPALAREVELGLGRLRRAALLRERSALNLELAARQREQAAERYRLGLAPLTETIQAEALAREAERQGVAARFAERRALAELERAAGVRVHGPGARCGG
jgi:outer membrane protein TolC